MSREKKNWAGTKVSVSQRAINTSTRRKNQESVTHCPVARALRTRTRKRQVVVVPYLLEVDGVRYEVPERVRSFMYAFDERRPVKPFTFRIGRRRVS